MEHGLTQEQVAELSGTNKSYISKLEKDLKDVRFSTLQRIVREGLGGHLEGIHYVWKVMNVPDTPYLCFLLVEAS